MRSERLAEEIRRELAAILQERVRDPGLGLAVVTRVELAPDGTHARVFVSFLGGESAEARGWEALQRAAAFIRRELAHRLPVRRVPELAFRVDHGVEYSLRVQQELEALGLGGGADAQAAGEIRDAGDAGSSGDSGEDEPPATRGQEDRA
jgi:ribosome-binding factor A